MTCIINGKITSFIPCTIAELLSARKCNPLAVVVEINQQILDKSQYSTHMIAENDTIEIVRFVGGG